MNVNATLLFELVLFFLLFYWVKQKVWPSFMAVLDKRQGIIAKGLRDAKDAEKQLDQVKLRAAGMLNKARDDARAIIDQAKEDSEKMLVEQQKSLTEMKMRHQVEMEAQIKGAVEQAKLGLQDVVISTCVDVLQKTLPRLSAQDKKLQQDVVQALMEEEVS